MKKIVLTLILATLTIVSSCKDGSKSNDSEKNSSSETTTTTENSSGSESSNSTNSETTNNSNHSKSTTNNSHSNTSKNGRTYIVRPDSTIVNWTAYKTTDKVAVGGVFTKINFNKSKGATIEEAFNNLEFSIPTNSIFSKNETRDQKLLAYFFHVMVDTKNITGKLSFNAKGDCTASITMNGITKQVHLKYFAGEHEVDFTANINLEDWDATGALTALNKACGDLHKGKDGKSKTWTEVAIHIKTKY